MSVRLLPGLLVGILTAMTPAMGAADESNSFADLDRRIEDSQQVRLYRQSTLAAAKYAAELLELQQRAAIALKRCAELGVRCSADQSIEDLQPPPLPAAPEHAKEESTPSAPTVAELPAPLPETLALPETLSRPASRPIPQLTGVTSTRGQFVVGNETLEAAKGETLPGGWTVTSISMRGATLTSESGVIRRLVLRWGTVPQAATADAPVYPNAVPPYPASFPMTGWSP